MQEKIEGAVKKHFKPEFINRLDGLVIFRPLDKPSLSQVIDLEFKKLQLRLAKKSITVSIDDAARTLLVDKGYLPEMGARPLRRVIEQYLEDPLAEKLLHHPNEEKSYLITVKKVNSFIDQEINKEKKEELVTKA